MGVCALRSQALRSIYLVLAIFLLLALPAVAAEEGYYVRAGVQPAQFPADRPGYDCAASSPGRPSSVAQSAAFMLDQVDPAPILDGSVFSPAPLVPTCYAVGQDVQLDLPFSSVPCERTCVTWRTWDGVAGAQSHALVYFSYNMTSGQYFYELPDGTQKGGKFMVTIEWDCIECPPPSADDLDG